MLLTIPWVLCAADQVALEHAWARATAPTVSVGVAFLSIVNETTVEAKITGASAPALCDRVELHTHVRRVNGTVGMEEIEDIKVAPGATTTLKPGGVHLMLMGLKKPLKQGEEFTLQVSLAGEPKPREVTVQIQGIAAMEAPVDGCGECRY